MRQRPGYTPQQGLAAAEVGMHSPVRMIKCLRCRIATVLSCLAISYRAIPHYTIQLQTPLNHTLPCYSIQIIPYFIILYFTMPCYTKLYNTILYHSKTIMRNTVYDTILYHTLLSYPIIFYMIYHNTRVCSGFMSVSLNPKP